MTVRLGLLGCGGIARAAHLPSLARIRDARVTALADGDPAALAAGRAVVPNARAVTSVEALLDLPDIDAVLVALPPALHATAALAALARGKHVYIEKPLATSQSDARRVLDAALDASLGAGRVVMMGFNYRFNPLVLEARARIADGSIGTPLALRTVFATPRRETPPWKQGRDTGGGVLLDLAVHHIDLARFLVGAEVTSAFAEVRSVGTEQDTAVLQLQLANGCHVQSFFSLAAVEDDRIDVYGSNGRLSIDRYRSFRLERTGVAAGSALSFAVRRFAGEISGLPYAVRRMRSPMHDPSFSAALEAFVGAVLAGTRASPDAADGYRAAAVVDAAERSARSGRVEQVADTPAVVPPRAGGGVARV